ncbi:MAG: hypothetical protein J7M26_06480 [Armatimonadetes bacterium]|nr:hypothetical protein [Armatimonadota bacterium]
MSKARRIAHVLMTLAGLVALGLAGASLGLAQDTEAYCYIREAKVNKLSNGVQIIVKADGFLWWMAEPGFENVLYNRRRSTAVAVRFPKARLALDKTLYQVDEDPVSTVTFYTPQDAVQGLGVVMKVKMTERSRVEAISSEDRQTFMLTVLGERTVEHAAGSGGGKAAKEGFIEVISHDGKLTVRAVKADIHKVVAQIAAKGHLSVAVDDAVKHKVSLNITDMEPLDIIKGIAAGYGLALSPVGDVYMLSEGVPSDLTTYRRSGTGSFPVRYLKARDAVSLLPTFLFKYVHDNPEQNAVVVTAPDQMLQKVKSDLEATDLPPPMIMIEALAVELTDEGDLTAGLNWSYQSPGHRGESNTETGDVTFESRHYDSLATAIAKTAQLQARLHALVTKGKAVIRANPRMAAVNGKLANIFIGQQRFIKVTYLQWGQQQERIQTIPVGVRLTVRPWTGGNKEITSFVQIEVSNIVDIDAETGLPRLSTRTATTTVRTRDGETIVIGGLIQRQNEKTYRKIPLLGDLPLIGPLFRRSSTNEVSSRLIILVRPRLLTVEGHLPDAAEDQAVRKEFLQPGDPGYPAQPAAQPAAQGQGQ